MDLPDERVVLLGDKERRYWDSELVGDEDKEGTGWTGLTGLDNNK